MVLAVNIAVMTVCFYTLLIAKGMDGHGDHMTASRSSSADAGDRNRDPLFLLFLAHPEQSVHGDLLHHQAACHGGCCFWPTRSKKVRAGSCASLSARLPNLDAMNVKGMVVHGIGSMTQVLWASTCRISYTMIVLGAAVLIFPEAGLP